MNEQLIRDKYLIVPNFISSTKAEELSNNFKEYADTHELPADPQVPNCIASKFDFIPFVELLVEKTVNVSQLVGETVLPTYSYARIYGRGNVLPYHVDKPECEISLTVNLSGDKDWIIGIYNDTGLNEVCLKPGDAMVYLGCDARHGREPFDGEECTQVFLHYVRSNGLNFKRYFDKDHRYKDDPVKVKAQPKATTVGPLNDYIRVYEDIFTPDECKMILDEYMDSDHWKSATVSSHSVANTSVRNCDIIGISTPDTINKNRLHRVMIDKTIFKGVDKAAQRYMREFPNCFLKSDSGYDLLRYKTGGYYRQHTDSFKEQPRTLALSINLNDDYLGGNLAFFDQETQIRGGAGSVVLFPANFMYPHEITDVTEGTRYSIVTWFT